MAQNCICCGRKLGLLSSYFTLGDGTEFCKDCAENHFFYNLTDEKELPAELRKYNKEQILYTLKNSSYAPSIKQLFIKDGSIQIGNYYFDLNNGGIFVDRTNEEHYRFFLFKDIKSMRKHTKKQTYGRKHLIRNMTIASMVAGNVGKYYAARHSPKKTIYNYLGEIVTFKDGSEYEFRAPVSTALIDSRRGMEEKKQYDYMVQILKRGKAQFKPKKQRARAKTVDPAKEIKELADLQKQGIITEDEFNTKKKQLLGL